MPQTLSIGTIQYAYSHSTMAWRASEVVVNTAQTNTLTDSTATVGNTPFWTYGYGIPAWLSIKGENNWVAGGEP